MSKASKIAFVELAAMLVIGLSIIIFNPLVPKVASQTITVPIIDPCTTNTPKSSVAINGLASATTQLVALSAGKVVYPCAYAVVVTTADNITFEYGTGSSCGTGTTALTGAMALGANGVLTSDASLSLLAIPAGNALCIVTSTAGPANGYLTYVQQ